MLFFTINYYSCYVKRVVELLLAPLAVDVHLKQRVDQGHASEHGTATKTVLDVLLERPP